MKAGFPSQKVLITNSSGAMGQALLSAFNASKINAVGINADDITWTNLEDVVSRVKALHPFLVINTFSIDPNHNQHHEKYAKRLANACKKTKIRIIHLSDYRVFGVDSKNTYFETDKVAPLSSQGETLVQAEQYMRQVEQHLVLRLSWLLNNTDNNPFTRLLRAFVSDEDIEASKDYQGAATWQSDVVRVLVAMTRQIFSGAENWGTLHCCSSDRCSELEFAQQIAQIFEEIKPLTSHLKSVPYKDRKDLLLRCEPSSATLSCRHLRNNFGIQARPWRQGLKGHIQDWLKQESKAGKAEKIIFDHVATDDKASIAKATNH